MGFHHVALATNDLPATHRFYTDVMGFTLAKVVIGPTENEGGWAKHVFYDTGDGLIAFWELHDEKLPAFDAAISTAVGLPVWINHIAFRAEPDELPSRIERWVEAGYDVMEIDHEFCHSVYAVDPNGTLVEFCADSRPLDDRDRRAAEAALLDPHPAMDPAKEPVIHAARAVAAH